MEFISRVVGGWNVRMTLGGKRRSRFFSDLGAGSKKAALTAATKYRDDLLAKRPERESKPRPIVIVRGENKWLQIRLPKKGGGSTTTEFSIKKHGAKGAKEMAMDAWSAALKTSKSKSKR